MESHCISERVEVDAHTTGNTHRLVLDVRHRREHAELWAPSRVRFGVDRFGVAAMFEQPTDARAQLAHTAEYGLLPVFSHPRRRDLVADVHPAANRARRLHRGAVPRAAGRGRRAAACACDVERVKAVRSRSCDGRQHRDFWLTMCCGHICSNGKQPVFRRVRSVEKQDVCADGRQGRD